MSKDPNDRSGRQITTAVGAYLNDLDYLARKERAKDLLREAEHERLIQTIQLKQPGHHRWHRRVAIWIRTQMEEHRSKLQGYDPVSPPNVVSTGMTDPDHSQN